MAGSCSSLGGWPIPTVLRLHARLLLRAPAYRPLTQGLMYSTQAFRYVRDYMLLGFALVWCPALALEWLALPGLAHIWLAKGAYNVWRLAGAAYLIYGCFLPRFGGARGGGGAAAEDEGGGGRHEDGGGSEPAAP